MGSSISNHTARDVINLSYYVKSLVATIYGRNLKNFVYNGAFHYLATSAPRDGHILVFLFEEETMFSSFLDRGQFLLRCPVPPHPQHLKLRFSWF
ncbi:hypothetical protein TNCV_4833451 [Trichonephila clavipes]|nr:hypothetical protein TNCV_4833451 [Trichonephila clavipes]